MDEFLLLNELSDTVSSFLVDKFDDHAVDYSNRRLSSHKVPNSQFFDYIYTNTQTNMTKCVTLLWIHTGSH